MTVVAVGFLALDGVLLVMAGAWSQRIGLLVWGVLFLFAAIGVYLYWRRHVKRLSELKADLEMRNVEFERLRQEIDQSRSE